MDYQDLYNKLITKYDLLLNENNKLKEQITNYTTHHKKYYENNKKEIIEKVKEYNKTYKKQTSPEKVKEYNKKAYEKRKLKKLNNLL
jgi:hypothetical protein